MAESPNDTSIKLSYLTDATGGLWSLVKHPQKSGQIALNGVVQTNTDTVVQLLYYNHVVYHSNETGKWFSWDGSKWKVSSDPHAGGGPTGPTGPSGPSGPTGPGESADGTEVPPAASITTGYSETWKLVNGQITINGVVQPETNSVVRLVYKNDLVYQTNSAGGWWCKARASDPWQDATDPTAPPIPPSGQKIQVPLGAYISTWFGHGGCAHYASWNAHAQRFIEQMGGRVPSCYAAPGTPYPSTNPDQWPIQTTYNLNNWPSMLPKEAIMINFWYCDASGRTMYDRATGYQWAGHDMSYWTKKTLDGYATIGVKKIYTRPAWEFNIGFQGQTVTNVSQFVAAMQAHYRAVHEWSAQTGVTVRVMWNPACTTRRENSWTVEEQFPGRDYVDVVAADYYAFANGTPPAQPSSDAGAWTLPAMVDLCRKYGKPLGFCELGDGLWNGEDPSVRWLPQLFQYLNSIDVPIELLTVWDIETIEFSCTGQQRQAEMAAWRGAMGAGGSLMTTPVA